jgi:hypothetical protein
MTVRARLNRVRQRFRLCKSMSTWAHPSLDHRVRGSGAGEYLADLRRQRRDAGKWRERIGDGLLGVFPRLAVPGGMINGITPGGGRTVGRRAAVSVSPGGRKHREVALAGDDFQCNVRKCTY